MKYKSILNSIKDFLVRLTDVLVPVVSVALLLGIIFGPEAPFVGDVYKLSLIHISEPTRPS